MNSVVLAGATGLIGQQVISQLVVSPDVERIVALTRRTSEITYDAKLSWQHSDPLTVPNTVKANVGLICLGTTLRQAGSKQALRRVDVDLVVAIAQQMKQAGVTRLGVISSHGANPHHLSHYLRCKGQMEQALEQLDFEHLTIVRPGPLKGERENPRFDELLLQKVVNRVQPMMKGPLANLVPIDAQAVARALWQTTLESTAKRCIVSAKDLHQPTAK
uniref:NAD(P)H-binding protein n=1 Tax=Thaumasiovibrio occultus TaxID=1891184 RepID=UPI000B35CC7A|nr:NAD(P)H-binding protein [Thaumasiovibrio occultus]